MIKRTLFIKALTSLTSSTCLCRKGYVSSANEDVRTEHAEFLFLSLYVPRLPLLLQSVSRYNSSACYVKADGQTFTHHRFNFTFFVCKCSYTFRTVDAQAFYCIGQNKHKRHRELNEWELLSTHRGEEEETGATESGQTDRNRSTPTVRTRWKAEKQTSYDEKRLALQLMFSAKKPMNAFQLSSMR